MCVANYENFSIRSENLADCTRGEMAAEKPTHAMHDFLW